jgi:hypothetical protein
MTHILASVGTFLFVLLVLFGAPPIIRNWAHARAERGAEQAAFIEAVPLSPVELEELEEQRRSRAWRASFNAKIDDIDRRFAELVAGLPTSGDDPFDQSYWPEVHEDRSPTVELHLAEFEPAAALAVITERNAAHPVFSWSTGSMPVYEPEPVPEWYAMRVRHHQMQMRSEPLPTS